MSDFIIDFEIIHYNGSIVIKAESPEEAEEKFRKKTIGELTAHTNEIDVDILALDEVSDG